MGWADRYTLGVPPIDWKYALHPPASLCRKDRTLAKPAFCHTLNIPRQKNRDCKGSVHAAGFAAPDDAAGRNHRHVGSLY